MCSFKRNNAFEMRPDRAKPNTSKAIDKIGNR